LVSGLYLIISDLELLEYEIPSLTVCPKTIFSPSIEIFEGLKNVRPIAILFSIIPSKLMINRLILRSCVKG